MLNLALPWALILLPTPILIRAILPPYRDQVAAIRIPFFRQITGAAKVEARAGAVILRRTRLQMISAITIWMLLVLALARPERLGDPVVIETAARDIVLALDISGSMDQHDFISSNGERMQRLDAVKSVMNQFITERDGDRIALIVFGTKAFVQAPFTEDLQSLSGFLDQTVVGMAGPNTAVGDAIGLSIRTFQASEVDQRLMILLSDGADTSSRMPPINAAAFAAEQGVTIYTIGVGEVNATGADRVDLDALQNIADLTGGSFFYADDQAALGEIYARIDKQNPRKVETLSFRPKESLTWMPLGLALLILCCVVGFLHLSSTRRGHA